MIIAFVHAKGKSERVANKNLRILGDKPLFCHAIRHAKLSSYINTVIIDSDSDEILRIGSQYGAIPLKRPKKLATNETTGDDLAYWQASNYPNSDIILQVIPTSPFISTETIEWSIVMLKEHNVNSVVGVRKENLYIWKDFKPTYYKNNKILNSYDLEPTIYETTGLYVNKTKFVLKNKKRIDYDNCWLFNLSKLESIDINTEEDFKFAEIVWNGLNKK